MGLRRREMRKTSVVRRENCFPVAPGPYLDSLVSYWKFNEASGDAIPAYGPNTLFDSGAVGTTTGVIAGARTFTTDDFLANGSTNLTFTYASSFTYAGWMRTSDFSTAPTIFQQTDGPTLYFNTDGTVIGQFDGIAVTPATVFSTNTWYHVAMTYNGTRLRVYRNGTLLGFDGPGGGTAVSGADLFFGVSSLVGALDEWGVWSRALGGSEISGLYNSGSGKTYPFN